MAAHDLQIYQPDAQVGELKLWRAPEEVLGEAQQAAVALQKRIAGKKKPVKFNGEQYIENDDWQMLAHFYGYAAKITQTEFVEYGEVQGFKAYADLINERTGAIVGHGEALCLDEEENWGPRTKYEWQDVLVDGKKVWENGKPRREKVAVGEVDTPLFQLASMSQTRACNKAISNKLKWVVSLAGYATTPAEDMHDSTLAPEKETAQPLPTEIKKKPLTPDQTSAPQTTASAARPIRNEPANENAGPRAAQQQARPPIQQPKAPQVRTISEGQARRFYAIWKQNGREPEDVKEFLQRVCGVTDDRQMPASLYERACKWAETGEDF
jgi:hypothetical protein